MSATVVSAIFFLCCGVFSVAEREHRSSSFRTTVTHQITEPRQLADASSKLNATSVHLLLGRALLSLLEANTSWATHM